MPISSNNVIWIYHKNIILFSIYLCRRLSPWLASSCTKGNWLKTPIIHYACQIDSIDKPKSPAHKKRFRIRLEKNKTHSNDMLPYDRVSLHLWKTCRCCKCFSRNESENLRDNASENSKNRISGASRLEVSPLFHAHVIFRPLREVTFAAQPRQFAGLPFLRETVLAFHLWAPIIISYHADSQSS